MRLLVLAGITGLVAIPANAEVVHLRATGAVTGFEYNPSGAAAIFAVAPIGTAYTLDFSYDTNAAPVFSNANYAAYVGAASAIFTLAGYTASFSGLGVTVGDTGMRMGDSFQLFGNAAFSPTERLAGYQLSDISFRVSDPTSTALSSGALPTAFAVAEFPNRSVRTRFSFGEAGETALLLSVASITTLDSAVPEPSAWALMIIGFGLVGASARRRQPAVA